MTSPLCIDPDSPALVNGVLTENLGIDSGGVLLALLHRGTPEPAEVAQVFSTSTDDQDVLQIEVLRGNRMMSADATSMGRLQIRGFQIGPAGIPQITLVLRTAGGGVWVSAKDAAGSDLEVKVLPP